MTVSIDRAYDSDYDDSVDSALWRQRLFEAEAGLTKFLVEKHGGRHFGDLLTVKSDIFSAVKESQDATPEVGTQNDWRNQDWQRLFFRAQAAMEKFVVTFFGLSELAAWAQSTGSIYGAIDPVRKRDATAALDRLRRQAVLYGSSLHWNRQDADTAELEIGHCAIWDYREAQRARGVPITLRTPCEYCVAATTALINNKGVQASASLHEHDDGHGCVWSATT